MKFINESNYQANALWGSHKDQQFGVCVLAKATYDCHNGSMVQSQENPWPVHFKPLETPYGVFPGEHSPFAKKRTDIVVCGKARSPGKRMVPYMPVEIAVSCFRYGIAVFGDRCWVPRLTGLTASDPTRFTSMPLTLDHAYGGKVNTEWGELANPYNAAGKGWYYDVDQAKGAALPNLEDPTNLIEDWRDQPVPVAPCVYAGCGGLMADLPENPLKPGRFVPIDVSGFGWAHPDLMVDKMPLSVGEEIRVDGIRHEGPMRAWVPAFGATAVVRCGQRETEVPFKLDTIIVQGEENRVVFRWRGAVTFPIQPRETRSIVLSAEAKR